MSRNQIRSNQLITTFGPGAMVDLPSQSIIVAGLEEWNYAEDAPCYVEESRLAAKIARALQSMYPTFNRKSVKLRLPPPSGEDLFVRGTVTPGVTGYVFPHWFVAQAVELSQKNYRRRPLIMRGQLSSSGKYKHQGVDRKGKTNTFTVPVVPIRFVRACKKGHVGDIQWRRFVHEAEGADQRCRQELWLEERGSTGDLSETWIACDCGAFRCITDALGDGALGQCNGSRPWLDDMDPVCGEANRFLNRTASNAYFSQSWSVISIPDSLPKLEEVVMEFWETDTVKFHKITEEHVLALAREMNSVLDDKLGDLSNADVLAAIDRVRNGETALAVARPVKEIEFDALKDAPRAEATDVPEGDFYARAMRPDLWNDPQLNAALENVTQVHRLREVVALIGFTRFEPETTDVTGELSLDVERAPLTREPHWMPVSENRGEGIFLEFKPEAIEAWRNRPGVQAREEELVASFKTWQKEHPGAAEDFLGCSYIMLHSLAHLLITAISLDCGYPLSSLRERIYAPDMHDQMVDRYGILIYTASAGVEGTLGGLVQAGREIRKHFRHALRLGALCSSDPACASGTAAKTDKVAGSACHGCLYIAETSCERFNQYLDRALVVPTIEHRDAAFFTL